LNVVVRKSATIFELLPCENEALLVWWDTLFVLDLRFNIVNGVGCLDVKCNRFTREGFHKDLHTAPQAQDEVQG